MDNTGKYCKYIEENLDKLCESVNQQFEISKDFLKVKLLSIIRQYITPLPTHYIWKSDNCPWDYSGIIVPDGIISLEQTISEFLENEYTGNTTATYISRIGLSYDTYGDLLSYETLELGHEIMFSVVKRELTNYFQVDISDEIFEEVMDIAGDSVYSHCMAYNFFLCEPAIDFVGIGEISLQEVVRKERRR